MTEVINTTSDQPTYKKSKARQEVDTYLGKLETGVVEIMSSDKYKDYLQLMAAQPNYSANNLALIYMQNPNATLVMSYNKWHEQFDRQVLRGQKGIRIIKPHLAKINEEIEVTDKHTGKTIFDANGKPLKETVKKEVHTYRMTSVFDVSQTDGRELPSITENLSHDVDDFNLLVEALKKPQIIILLLVILVQVHEDLRIMRIKKL